MDKYKELCDRILQFREYLHKLIANKNNLQDPEIISASRMLDSLLNEYRQLKEIKIDKNS
ncbi:MAG TPA: aspartyl-phosphate phosphatase Spo0E family protein [Clostridiaceae bacterium]|nr:aspartyl-phosphate phosphatase Spo0E family protein [Clostridiaceae bacterium]